MNEKCVEPQSENGSCEEDQDCEEGFVCMNNVCSMPGTTGDICLVDSNCMIGLDCIQNECAEPVLSPSETDDPCEEDQDCE